MPMDVQSGRSWTSGRSIEAPKCLMTLSRLSDKCGISDMVDVTGIFFIPAKRSIGAPYSRSLLPWMPVVPVVNIGFNPYLARTLECMHS